MIFPSILAAGCLLLVEPALVRGPYLQSLLATSVDIAWRTEEESLGAVRVRLAEGPKGPEGHRAETTFTEAAPGTDHRVQVTGLAPGKVHEYVLLDADRVLAEGFRFRTAPPPGEGELHAVVVGDSGDGLKKQYAVAALLLKLEPDLFLHTGDYDYAEDLDESVFAPYRDLLPNACFLPARGNHDIRVPWRDTFILPGVGSTKGDQLYYSFDWGPVHFAFLDSNLDALAGGDQVRWLESDLAAARERRSPWVVLVLHEPIHTVGGYSRDRLAARSIVEEAADRFEVDLVLSGHDHNYQRSHPVRSGVAVDAWQDPVFTSPRGTIYLVTGGGGAILYPEFEDSDHRFTRLFRYAHHALDLIVSQDELGVRAISATGEVLDAFVIERTGSRREYRFVRGDVDANGRLDLADVVVILGHLFLGSAIECPVLATEAADVDGGGARVDLGDAVYLLGFLFQGGPPPAPPFPGCGPAEDAAGAWCTEEACRG